MKERQKQVGAVAGAVGASVEEALVRRRVAYADTVHSAVYDAKWDAIELMDDLLAEVRRLQALERDALRYRWLADNGCDVIMCVSTTDYGDGDTRLGPRVEIGPDQYGVGEFGSAKTKLDAAIDAAMDDAARERT